MSDTNAGRLSCAPGCTGIALWTPSPGASLVVKTVSARLPDAAGSSVPSAV